MRGSMDRTSPNRPRRIRLLLGCLALLVVCGLLLAAADRTGIRQLAPLAGTIAGLAAFFFGVVFHDLDPVTPRRLALVGWSGSESARGSMLLGYVGLPFAMLAVGALAHVVLAALGSADLLAVDWIMALAAFLGAIVGVDLVVGLAKLGGLLGASLDRRRAGGDWKSAAALGAALALSPALFLLIALPQDHEGALSRVLELAAEWNPLGAPWAAGFAADHLTAGVLILIGALTARLVWFLAFRSARGQHARALYSGGASGPIRLGVFERFAGTPAGAIAARSCAYWLRDPRYRLLAATAIAVPVLVLVPLWMVGVPATVLAMIPVPVLGFLLGWMLHNDLAYDGSAVWMHVTSGMSGASDRLGRAAPTLVVGGIAVVLGSLVTGLFTLDWAAAASNLGIAACLLMAATGFSSIVSAISPYPVARPGDSPFSQPVRSWGSAAVLIPFAGLAAVLCAAPAISCALIAFLGGDWWWHLVALGLGLLIGAIALVVGIRQGGRAFERRTSEIMQFASAA